MLTVGKRYKNLKRNGVRILWYVSNFFKEAVCALSTSSFTQVDDMSEILDLVAEECTFLHLNGDVDFC